MFRSNLTHLWDTSFCRMSITKQRELILKGGLAMKGYFTAEGYMGYIDGEYRLFVSYDEYREMYED